MQKLQRQSLVHLAEREKLQLLLVQQAEELQRTQQQKDRLEGLCRRLQVCVRRIVAGVTMMPSCRHIAV